jgi:ribosomal protein S18 acetylase RimI-like enzyme
MLAVSKFAAVIVGADSAAAALLDTWQRLGTAAPGGWSRTEGGGAAVAASTGVPLPTLNGVWVGSAQVEPEVIRDLLEVLAATGLPHCLQVRPDDVGRLTVLAESLGMTADDQIPMMVLEGEPRVAADQATSLVIRELTPPEAHLHARVAAAGFEAPEDPFLQLMTPSALAAPGVRCYLGEIDGQAVTTGMGVTVGDRVGIFNIATPPEHRRRGYGTALTARAIADGYAAGATWSWLQSSAVGYRIYEQLGFQTVEEWSCWLSADSSSP